jgi:CHAT domain-containing protein
VSEDDRRVPGSATTPDEQLGWRPIREVPERFVAAVENGQDALGAFLERPGPAAAHALARVWGGIVADSAFGSAPLAFRLDLINRGAVALWWSGARADAAAGFERALALAPMDWDDRARYLTNLGRVKLDGYRLDGQLVSLDEAVNATREAARLSGDPSSLRVLVALNAAEAHATRHRARGDPADLTEAQHFAELGVEVSEVVTTHLRVKVRLELAEVLARRFDAYGRIADIQRAIEEAGIALDRASTDAELNEARGVLGRLLRNRGSVMDDLGDLDRAVELLTPHPTHPDASAARLTNLGSALLDRHRLTGDPEDLRRAVTAQEQSVQATRQGDFQLASRHNNAGNSMSQLFDMTGDREALQRAIDHCRESVALTSPTAPELASRKYNLGNALRTAAGLDGGELLTPEAHDAYRDACQAGLSRDLRWALGAARAWGNWAAAIGHWSEAAEAYSYGIRALDELFRRQPGRDEKEVWLGYAPGLAVDAALALTIVGDPAGAIVALEHGRAFMLSEVLERDRASLSELHRRGPSDLARRYRAASEALRRATDSSDLAAASDDLDVAIASIRDVQPDFLRPPELADVQRAAATTPVVYLVPATRGGAALIARREAEPVAIPLPELHQATVEARARAFVRAYAARGAAPQIWRSALDTLTAWLWRAAMAPVLRALDGAPTAVLVPAGLLGTMPLHAAWTHDPQMPTGRRYALDAMTVTYAPNARARAGAEDAARRASERRLLGIDNPSPTTAGPVAGSSVEVAAVRAWFPESEVLLGADATRAATLERLPRADVMHFACHGFAVPSAPLESALVLASDEQVTLRDMLSLRLANDDARGPRLAILSACESSRPGDALPDEVVSLAAGLLQAGLAGVVACQWAVDGVAAAMLISVFSDRWRCRGAAPGDALQAAQCWMRDTTNAEKAAWLRARAASPELRGTPGEEAARMLWRATARKAPDARSFAHPDAWAAFAHMGA